MHIPAGGRHVLAFDGSALVATLSQRHVGCSPPGSRFWDGVRGRGLHPPVAQGMGVGSGVMRRLAADAQVNHDLACLDTDRVGLYAPLGSMQCSRSRSSRDGSGDGVGRVPLLTTDRVGEVADAPCLDGGQLDGERDRRVVRRCWPHATEHQVERARREAGDEASRLMPAVDCIYVRWSLGG
jgi:hypothetical protein